MPLHGDLPLAVTVMEPILFGLGPGAIIAVVLILSGVIDAYLEGDER